MDAREDFAEAPAPVPPDRPSRRRLLGGGVAALSGLFAFLGGARAARAATGDNAKVGEINAGASTTFRSNGLSALIGITLGNTASSNGVFGKSESTTGRGVFGLASATSGSSSGVIGQSMSGTGVGVKGLAAQPTGIGVLGSGPTGVRGVSAAPAGRGVVGQATATTGPAYGVLGLSDSPEGVGVRGEARATASSGWSAIGVLGRSSSADGVGVEGRCDGADGVAVHGSALGTAGIAVRGTAVHIAGEFVTNTHDFPNSIALNVQGRTVFENSGFAAIPAGFGAVVVRPDIPLRNSSLILAMLQTDPGVPGVAVSHVRWEIQDPSQFTIVLTGNVAEGTAVAWFVIG